MAVRQANGGERQPVLLDHAEYGLGMVAGVDEDSLTGSRVVVEIPLDGIAADVGVERHQDPRRDGRLCRQGVSLRRPGSPWIVMTSWAVFAIGWRGCHPSQAM